jgi:hypothetical protein
MGPGIENEDLGKELVSDIDNVNYLQIIHIINV